MLCRLIPQLSFVLKTLKVKEFFISSKCLFYVIVISHLVGLDSSSKARNLVKLYTKNNTNLTPSISSGKWHHVRKDDALNFSRWRSFRDEHLIVRSEKFSCLNMGKCVEANEFAELQEKCKARRNWKWSGWNFSQENGNAGM